MVSQGRQRGACAASACSEANGSKRLLLWWLWKRSMPYKSIVVFHLAHQSLNPDWKGLSLCHRHIVSSGGTACLIVDRAAIDLLSLFTYCSEYHVTAVIERA